MHLADGPLVTIIPARPAQPAIPEAGHQATSVFRGWPDLEASCGLDEMGKGPHRRPVNSSEVEEVPRFVVSPPWLNKVTWTLPAKGGLASLARNGAADLKGSSCIHDYSESASSKTQPKVEILIAKEQGGIRLHAGVQHLRVDQACTPGSKVDVLVRS
jgi:hypothetical protein